jgi:superfamily II DNA helicase RecQ
MLCVVRRHMFAPLSPPLPPAFRQHEWQTQAINHLNNKQSLLIIQPTGSGKSLVYQQYAMEHPHELVIVVSPLIALINDQLQSIRNGRYHTLICDSLCTSQDEDVKNDTSDTTITRIHELLDSHQISLLYVTPESFQQPKVQKQLYL